MDAVKVAGSLRSIRGCHEGSPCHCLCHRNLVRDGKPVAKHVRACCETCASCGAHYRPSGFPLVLPEPNLPAPTGARPPAHYEPDQELEAD